MWKKANPSLDKTIGMDKVVAACNSAKETPGEENAFRQLRLNQWVKQAIRWMPMEKWDKCKVAFDEEMLAGHICYGGLDLSSTTDITAFVLVFPPTEDDEHYYVLPYFWLPEETLPLRVRRDHVSYDIWEWQGYKYMSSPTKELMKLTLEQTLAHNGHPVLRWMMDNIFIRRDPAGNIKPDKEKSTEKIDGAVAMIMALDRAIRCGCVSDESVYDTREMLVL